MARALHAEGATVRVLARKEMGGPFETIEGTVTDTAALARATEGVDTVYHFAAYSDVSGSIRDPAEAFRSGDEGTFRLLEASRTQSVNRFLYCSTARVYGDPTRVPVDEEVPLAAKEPYGATKLAGEIWTRAYYHTYGLKSTILRPFSVYGPGRVAKPGSMSGVIPIFVERALKGEPLRLAGDGLQTKDFTYVTDVVDGFLAAARTDGGVGHAMNLGAGRGVRVRDLAQIVIDATGSASKIEQGPPSKETVSNYADSRLAEKLLGWKAKVSIEEGIRKYVAWFKEARA